MIQADQSDWSLDSVEVQPHHKPMEQDESSFNHTTLHEQYSYESKNPPTSKPIIDAATTLHTVGKITSIVQDFVVVQADNNKVINLESYVLNKDKNIVGYVVDVLGPVGHHYYAIKQQGEHVAVGQTLYFTQGCKILEDEDIRNLKQVGAVNDIDSDDQKQQQIPSKAFKRNRQQSFDFRSKVNKPTQPAFNPNNITFVSRPGQQPMYNTNTTGFFQQVPGFNPNFMFGYQNNNPQMNTMAPQINTPQMNMSAINQLYTPQPPTNPQQMLLMSQYYQNCYSQMMYNQSQNQNQQKK